MDMSKLSASDRRIFITAIVVVVGGVVSIVDRWGIGGILGGLAGLAAALVVLQPQLMPTMKLPAPKATSLLVLGGIAAVGFVLSALQYIGFVFDIRLVHDPLRHRAGRRDRAVRTSPGRRTRPRPRRSCPGCSGGPRRASSAPPPPPPPSRPPASPDPGRPTARDVTTPTPGAVRRAFFPLGVGEFRHLYSRKPPRVAQRKPSAFRA